MELSEVVDLFENFTFQYLYYFVSLMQDIIAPLQKLTPLWLTLGLFGTSGWFWWGLISTVVITDLGKAIVQVVKSLEILLNSQRWQWTWGTDSTAILAMVGSFLCEKLCLEPVLLININYSIFHVVTLQRYWVLTVCQKLYTATAPNPLFLCSEKQCSNGLTD